MNNQELNAIYKNTFEWLSKEVSSFTQKQLNLNNSKLNVMNDNKKLDYKMTETDDDNTINVQR